MEVIGEVLILQHYSYSVYRTLLAFLHSNQSVKDCVLKGNWYAASRFYFDISRDTGYAIQSKQQTRIFPKNSKQKYVHILSCVRRFKSASRC